MIRQKFDRAIFSVMPDNWSTKRGESVLVMPGRVMIKEFNAENYLLQFSEHLGSHTTESFKEKIDTVLADQRVADALAFVIVTDGDPAIKAGAAASKILLWSTCAAHLLSNAINASLSGSVYKDTMWGPNLMQSC